MAEGEWNGNWTVVIQFPSMESAVAFYESEGYAPLRALRIDELTEWANNSVDLTKLGPARAECLAWLKSEYLK